MYVKIRKNSGTAKRSVLICHNVRVRGKIHRIVIKTLGHSAQDSLLEEWLQSARQWIQEHGAHWRKEVLPIQKQRVIMKHSPSLFNLKEQARMNVGVEDIFGKLYQELT